MALRNVSPVVLALMANQVAANPSGPSGWAVTAESAGREKGCVAYTSSWVDQPGRRPSRKLIFDMENRCNRPVWIQLARQTDQSPAPGGARLLGVGERLSGAGVTHNYIVVWPYTTHLRYWLWQHSQRPTTLPSFRNCHLKYRDAEQPPCPPAVTVFGQF